MTFWSLRIIQKKCYRVNSKTRVQSTKSFTSFILPIPDSHRDWGKPGIFYNFLKFTEHLEHFSDIVISKVTFMTFWHRSACSSVGDCFLREYMGFSHSKEWVMFETKWMHEAKTFWSKIINKKNFFFCFSQLWQNCFQTLMITQYFGRTPLREI